MGIFDVFKTKVGEAAEKAGDVAGKTWDKAGGMAGQAKDKVSDMMDKKKDGAADAPSAPAPTASESPAQARAATAERASDMVSEGAPVSAMGEAAPGVGDDGMTQSIKDNVSQGADKAGEMAEDSAGNRYDDKIDSGARQAKDKLG